jgi:hypothetical protein
LSAGTYYATFYDNINNCYSPTTAFSASVIAPPTATIVETDASCTPNDDKITSGSSAILTASGGATYRWSTNATSAAISVNPTVNTTYTVTVTNTNGCTAIASKTISIVALPNVSTSKNNDLSCAVTTATLTASPTTGVSYTWSGGGTGASKTVASAGSYTVTVTDNASGCSSTGSITVNSNTNTPSVSVTKNNDLSCAVTTATLTASPTTGVSYAWSGGGTGASKTVASAGLYTVTVTDNSSGCSSTGSITVNSNTNTPSVSVTKNNDLSCAVTTATLSASPTTGVSYTWSGGGTGASKTVASAGSYTVTVTDNASGCSSTGSVMVNSIVNTLPSPILSTTTKNNICPATSVDISTISTNNLPVGSILEWHNASTPTAASKLNVFNSLNAGTYYAVFHDLNSDCYSSATAVTAIVTLCQTTNNGGVSSGNEGGLESDDCLSEAIAKRNFQRIKNPAVSANGKRISFDNISDLPLFTAPTMGSLETRGAYDLEHFIPQNPLKIATNVYLTTPNDLIGITNAKKVLSVDYFDKTNQKRVAAVLSTLTESKVYNHTKVICDRLIGSQLLSAEKVTLEGMNFILSTLQRENGVVEYNINFSVNQENTNSVVVTSQWSLDAYSEKPEYWNFQVWADLPTNAQQLTTEIINKFKVQFKTVTSATQPAVPKVFVKKGSYDNGVLTLTVQNPIGATHIVLEGTYAKSETQKRELFNKTMTLTGATEEKLEIFVGSIFDLGFTVRNNKSSELDALYFADGAWGLDYVRNVSKIDFYEVASPIPTNENNIFTVERSPILRGYVKDYVSIFRSLRPASAAVDMSKYKNLTFTASGTDVIEVTLVKKSIAEWAKQYRSQVRLFSDKQVYTLAIKDYSNGTN